MKERRYTDQVWVEQRDLNRQVNEALRDGFIDGQVYRRGISARRIMAVFLRKQTNQSNQSLPTGSRILI